MELLEEEEKEFLMRQDILDAIDNLDFDYIFNDMSSIIRTERIFQFLNDSEYCGFEKTLGKNILNWMSFIPRYCFWERNITDITIPDSITSIEQFAFEICTLLQHVELPNSISKIEYCAFSRCSSLNEIVIPDSVTNIGSYAFAGCGKNFTIYCHSGSYAEEYAKENDINYKII